MYVRRDARSWRTTLPVAPLRHCVAAKLSNYGLPDAVILAGTTPLMAIAPGIHSTTGYLPLFGPGSNNATNDIAALVAGGGAPTRDALALVGPVGLRILKPDGNGNFSVTLAQAGSWQDAQLVAAHPDDPNTIFGVAAGGTGILVATQSQAHFWSTTAVELGSPIRAIEAVRWNGDTIAELAVLTDAGVTIRNRDGSAASSLFAGTPVSPASRSLVRVRYGLGEVVAWLEADPTGGAELYVCGATPGGSAWKLGNTDFVALASGDWTNDGQDDLFLSKRTGDETTLLVNAAPVAPFIFGNLFGFRIPQASTPAQSNMPVAVRDFDGDTDGDLFAVGLVDSGRAINQLVASKVYDLPFLDCSMVEKSGTYTATLQNFVATVPGPNVPPMPITANAIEVIAWQCILGTAPHKDLSPTTEFRFTVPLTAGAQEFSFDIDPNVAADPGLFGIVIRPVRIEGNLVLPAGNPHVGLLATDENVEAWVLENPGGGLQVPSVTPKPPLPPTPI